MTKEENAQRLARLKQIVSSLPEKPGSYQYYDAEGTIIYVGKAKNLKSRVSSYFHTEVDRFKTKVLVSKIHNITYTVVNTEEDALLLENSLIKKYNPRYNVLLKDGKTYPSICITNEPFPRIFKTRTINKKWGTYFGPFSHQGAMHAMLELIGKLYHPRTCRQPMTREGVEAGKYSVCLEYHIKNCGGPCIGKQLYDDYRRGIEEAKEILRGNTRGILKQMREEMERLAEELRFEEAEEVKRRYLLIDAYTAKSEVVSHTITNVDCFSISSDESTAFINFIHVQNGAIVQSFTFEYKKKLNETDEELLSLGIVEMRERFGSESKEIIVPFEIDIRLEGVVLTVPQRGDKKTILDLSVMNGKQYCFDRLKQAEKLNPEQRQVRLMKEIQDHLKLPKLPMRIECFDNSNISGTDAVAACVVFEKMKPAKKEYRKYNIKTVVGPDDYASMKEVVRRRYSRILEEQKEFRKELKDDNPPADNDVIFDGENSRKNGITPLPDLIITDGGKGQMEVVRQVVEDELGLSIPIAGLAKDSRHRTSELLYGFPPVVVGMKTTSELFRLLTQMQDEVHRFAITFHRDKRSKSALHSELDDIKGIGAKTRDALLTHFKSVKRIKSASTEEIASVIGKAKAEIIINHFATEQES